MAEQTANDLMPGDEVDGHEVATVARSGLEVRVTFTDRRFKPRVLERWEPVPSTIDTADEPEDSDEFEPEDESGEE